LVSKAANQRHHARVRAAERYGLVYDRDLRARLRRMVTGQQTEIVERQSKRVSVREAVLDGGLVVRFVWDRETREVVTFLDRDSP
jgi:hypothetical protein